MMRPLTAMLLSLALACGEDSGGSEESGQECDDRAPALPPIDDQGNPWPTYSEANAELADCTVSPGYRRFRGTCSDGKRFLGRDGGFTGDTRFYEGETLVGTDSYTDIIIPCDDQGVGDWSCEVTRTEEIPCPQAP